MRGLPSDFRGGRPPASGMPRGREAPAARSNLRAGDNRTRTDPSSIHLEAEDLVRPLRAQRILARFEAVSGLDAVKPLVEAFHVDADWLRPFFGPEDDLAMAALDVELVQSELLGR